MEEADSHDTVWPSLSYKEWKPTCQTLHRWIQIVGKTRTQHAPKLNHSWNSTLYVSARGLTTSLIPVQNPSLTSKLTSQTTRDFSIELDLLYHELIVLTTDGHKRVLPLKAQPVAHFYGRFCTLLDELGIEHSFFPAPNEVPDPIPFSEDTGHATYDPETAHRYWQSLVQTHRVFQNFRSRFLGKCSPVHLFWGSLDLAVTRFSGRRAPEHPAGIPTLPDRIAKEAYSHEVSSCGFWPGNEMIPYPAFYSYCYPQPEGFEKAIVSIPGAFYHPKLREYILPYDDVRKSDAPFEFLTDFLQKTYEAAASLGKWDRKLLEESRFLTALQEKDQIPGSNAA